jgi:L-threonylcarbamoyladenylate synthase
MANPKIISGEDQEYFCGELSRSFQEKQLVIFPADSMYVLAFDFLDQASRERVYLLKNRPQEKKIYTLFGDASWLQRIGIVPNEMEAKLMKKFWPGNLRIVFSEDFAGGVPKSAWLRSVINKAQVFVAGTSANISGNPLVKRAADLEKEIVEGVDKVFIDDSKVIFQAVPTLMRAKGKVEILRPGDPPTEDIERELLGP